VASIKFFIEFEQNIVIIYLLDHVGRQNILFIYLFIAESFNGPQIKVLKKKFNFQVGLFASHHVMSS
jgi:hypothetical protein